MFYLYNCYATHVPGSASVFILNVRIHLGYDHTTMYFFIIQVRWSDCSQTFTIASSAVSELFSVLSRERVWPWLRAVSPPSACARTPGGLVAAVAGPEFLIQVWVTVFPTGSGWHCPAAPRNQRSSSCRCRSNCGPTGSIFNTQWEVALLSLCVKSYPDLNSIWKLCGFSSYF